MRTKLVCAMIAALALTSTPSILAEKPTTDEPIVESRCPAGGCGGGETEITCNDSDGGRQAYIKGTVFMLGCANVVTCPVLDARSDYCVSPIQIAEFYCNTAHSWAIWYQGCTCSNGKCV